MIGIYIHLTWWRYQMGTFPMSSVDYPHKVQCRGALIFTFICAWTNGWTNNQDAGDLNWLWHYRDEAVVNCHSTEIWQTCQSRYRFCGLILSIPYSHVCRKSNFHEYNYSERSYSVIKSNGSKVEPWGTPLWNFYIPGHWNGKIATLTTFSVSGCAWVSHHDHIKCILCGKYMCTQYTNSERVRWAVKNLATLPIHEHIEKSCYPANTWAHGIFSRIL